MAELVVRSPYDGTELARLTTSTPEEVDEAVARAKAAHDAGALPPWQRAEILDRAARALSERAEDFARTIVDECAKPLKAARVEARRAVTTFTFAALEARRQSGEMVAIDAAEVGEGRLAFTLRVPIGVVAAITPFNFPLNLVAHKVAPAVAAGCPVVLKPAEQAPLTALALAELLVDDCGLPSDLLNVVLGEAEVGQALVDHPDVAYISFTGSGAVGWAIKERAPRKKVALELGNSSPVVIDTDGNWDRAARSIAVGGFAHAGQSCVSVQRVFVHAQVADQFCAALTKLAAELVVGDPRDEGTDVSAMIDTGHRDRVVSWIDEAVAAGAERLTGGELRDGILVPTVLRHVRPEMRVCRDEVFGPVVAIQTYRDFDEALRLADDTRYGLQAGVFTARIGAAMQAAGCLHFGTVLINEIPTWRADQMPYGGVRDSGNTKEGPAYAVREMTEERLVVVQP